MQSGLPIVYTTDGQDIPRDIDVARAPTLVAKAAALLKNTPSAQTPTRDQSGWPTIVGTARSEEHTSELQSRGHLVCRLLLEKKKKKIVFKTSWKLLPFRQSALTYLHKE